MSSFNTLGLPKTLVARLADQGITDASPIQALALPALIAGRDGLVEAQTGSGKTLAYLLPALTRLAADPRPTALRTASGQTTATPLLLVLVPTQELAVQVRDVAVGLTAIAKQTPAALGATEAGVQGEKVTQTASPEAVAPLRVVGLYGGANPTRQVEQLKAGADIIVGTAGRILEMVSKGRVSLAKVCTIVLDEVDQLADVTHRGDVTALVVAAKADKQMVAVSATLTPPARSWAAGFMRDPVTLAVIETLKLPATITHQAFVVDDRDQLPMLRKLLRALAPTGALAFFNRSADIDLLVAKLRHHGVKVAGLHAGIKKLERAQAMRQFRAGNLDLLLATELAARGLDFGRVSVVFNLDLPRGPAEYAHRVGRTGRMGRPGTAITLTDPKEKHVLGKFEKALDITFEYPVYVFGEVREATDADAKRIKRKESLKAKQDEARNELKAEREAAEAEGRPMRKPKAPKKVKAAPTAQIAKGKARKTQRKQAGKWKPSQEKPPAKPKPEAKAASAAHNPEAAPSATP